MAIPEPARQGNYGFLYFPPLRVQGYSVAGEETFVHVPELDVCFDVGRAPRAMLTSNFVALSHGHMDHSAGIAYYFSQRVFQGMGTGTLVCPAAMAEPIRRMMESWAAVEYQRTPHTIIGLPPEGELEIKKHIFLRAFEVNHTVPSLGYVVVEKRSKLKDEYAGLPQEKLVDLKKAGHEITYIKEVPLVAYIGDTAPGPFFARPDVAGARILITECTFVEEGHQGKAKIGKHLHVDDIAEILRVTNVEHLILTHLSRRTHLGQAKQQLDRLIRPDQRHRVHILMDHRVNRARYEKQLAEDAQATQA
jgi:ribonuclease Z